MAVDSNRKGLPSPTGWRAWPGLLTCIVGVVLANGWLSACTRTPLPLATPQHAQLASAHWPGSTVTQLNQGRKLYLSRCSSCHQPVDPKRISPQDWPQHIAEMRARSKLTDKEARLIERYLITVSEYQRNQS